MTHIPKALKDSALEEQAAHYELDAAFDLFKAALMRGDSAKVTQTSAHCQIALQRYLDAIAGNIALARQVAGL